MEPFPRDSGIIYYSIGKIPDVSNKSIPSVAMEKAINIWQAHNPKLKFTKSANSDVRIMWMLEPEPDHVGLASCKSDYRGRIIHCVVDVAVGGTSCNGTYFQTRENGLTNVIMHELGHTLGIGHTLNEEHLMYSTESPQDPLDEMGYTVPDMLPDLSHTTDLMQIEIDKKLAEIDRRSTIIDREREDYEALVAEYEKVRNPSTPDEFKMSQELHNRVDAWNDRINDLISDNNDLVDIVNMEIDERNSLVEEINAISNEKACDEGLRIT